MSVLAWTWFAFCAAWSLLEAERLNRRTRWLAMSPVAREVLIRRLYARYGIKPPRDRP